MSAVKVQAVLRKAERVDYVRFDTKDRKRANLTSTIELKGKELAKLEAKIDRLKEQAKPVRKEVDDAVRELIQGKSVKVAVTELHMVERNEVWVRRDDNQEIIQKRAMTDDDRQMKLEDGTETIEIDDEDD